MEKLRTIWWWVESALRTNSRGEKTFTQKKIAVSSITVRFKNNHQYPYTCFEKIYKQKSLPDRRSFLKDKRACFGCYGYNHVSKGCVKKRICEICHKNHPTGLHDPNFQPMYPNDPRVNTSIKVTPTQSNVYPTVNQAEPSTVSNTDERSTRNNASEEGSTQSSTCYALSSSMNNPVLQAILPVKVKCQKSGVTVDTYALYDNGSSGCFITNALKENLSTSGSRTTLALQTMHGSECIQTEAISDLLVSDIEGNNTLQLPIVFTRARKPSWPQSDPEKRRTTICIIWEVPEYCIFCTQIYRILETYLVATLILRLTS